MARDGAGAPRRPASGCGGAAAACAGSGHQRADPIAAAEEYAVLYPQRAALIRRLGRVPDNVSFGPPEEHLVRALVSSRTPALLALDRQAAEARAP